MRDLGLVNHNEPVKRLFTQGLVLKAGTAIVEIEGQRRRGRRDGAEIRLRHGGVCIRCSLRRRKKDLEWSEQAIEGCSRFLHRVHGWCCATRNVCARCLREPDWLAHRLVPRRRKRNLCSGKRIKSCGA